MIHHNFRKGQRLFVIMRDGSKIIGKFSQKKSKGIMLESGELVRYIDVRSITILRGDTNASRD